MKKLILFLAALAIVGCSDDDDNSSNSSAGTSFSFDGTTYQLVPQAGMSEIVMEDVADYNGVAYDRSTISIVGMNGTSQTATVSFDLYYKSGTSVEGTYAIYDQEADETGDFEEFLDGQNRGSMGWTSMGMVFNINTSAMTSGNNPTGTVKVVKNSANNYTLTYNGNFRMYQNGFTFVRNMPASINVVSNVITQ
ncbi:MAG: hypothetical protein IR153_01120 [Flavobacterium sp.]|nr:hypothetical protein [Flavobacterium sp.]